MVDTQIEMTIPSERQAVRQVHAAVVRFGTALGLEKETYFDIALALEEVLANVVRYAFPPGERRDIVVRLHRQGDFAVAEVEDEGKPFDPLKHPPPDFSIPVEDRPPGGMGIHFVRRIMDELEYTRRDGRNCFTMKKRLTG